MKTRLISVAILFTILTGCSGGNTLSETMETQAAATQTSVSTTMAAVTTADEMVMMVNESRGQIFDTYDELMAEYNKGRSGNYVYPLPEITDSWTLEKASLCPSNYTLRYDDAANDVSVMLEIGYNYTLDKISDYFGGDSYSYGGFTIDEMTDRYAVVHYTEFDDYAIIGITGEENIRYTLVVNSDDETKDPIALLKEYKEILEL